MVSKRHIYQSKHPFNVHSFEALSSSSWKAVESILIKNGTMSLNFVDKQCTFNEKVPFTNVRVKSRQATISDCTCFLRPGVDVCVLSTVQQTEHSSDEETEEPVWLDGRISSIARKPHESGCSCEFYINFYTNQRGLGSFRETLSKEQTAVRIDRISILQRLGQYTCEDQYYRWDLSEDSSLRQKTKLLLGKFLTDMSWLLVTSAVKKSLFDVKSVKNKLAYQILQVVEQSTSFSSRENLHAVSFRVDKGVLVPIVVEVFPDDSIGEHPTCDKIESGPSLFSDTSGLRRSKRRNIQPERFLGCDSGSEIDIGYVRTRPYKIDRGQDDDLHVPLSRLFGVNGISAEPRGDTAKESESRKRKSIEDPGESKTKSKKMKSSVSKQYERQPQEATAPVSEQNDPLAFEYYRVKARNHKDREQDLDEICPQYYYSNSGSQTQNMGSHGQEDFELETKWSTKSFTKKLAPKKKYRYPRFNSAGERTYQKRSLHAGAYTELINAFLKNIDCNSKEQPDITEQWKESTKPNSSDLSTKTESPPVEDVEEISETEMLWQECELALASLYVLEGNEGSNVNDVSSDGRKVAEEDCRHEYVADDELGILCDICGAVITGIRDVVPPFAQNTIWYPSGKNSNDKDLDHGPDNAANMDFTSQGAPDEPLSEDKENVWALIPDIKRKLHLHQKKAFEFLWENIAGTLKPDLMDSISNKKTGGCVISHTPGAGKTFLIIAFLVSYLKLFPGKRPLILAPKTTLYTWYKEFIKWKIPVPVYLIHGRRTYRVFRQTSVSLPGGPKPTDDVRHILDCLEKIQKWHSHPSVLVMGYTSFLSLMRENSKFEHRKFMAKVLRESPGLLVLDEGHNPRSTKSRLRKALMKVETELRIMLSGTVFQNNFCEYFNTLCLARPKFVDQVLKALDPKYKKNKEKLAEKARTLMEARARKFFLDIIAKKIDSNEGQDRKKGLKMLKRITSRFIDVYESGGSDSLPGLEIYTMLMNSTESQHDILVKLHRIMSTYNGYPLELELLITLGSIHPWLVRTSQCANKFFSEEELAELDKCKYDLKKGSKVKFVLNLVYRVVKTEKILIFCHNIAPVKLFVELFERVFGWQRGREVLVLTGDLELFERGRVMDRFEEPGGASRVLLASITACAEGISLTAASRVIMLDSEWNPSKTKQAIARAFRPGQQKVVYVYQLLATGTLEEDKYRRTTWKEWVSSMIFSEDFVEDPSKWQAEKIEDDVLREMVAEDKTKSFHMIMKNEKASTVIRSKCD